MKFDAAIANHKGFWGLLPIGFQHSEWIRAHFKSE